jgi:hypothetical protein
MFHQSKTHNPAATAAVIADGEAFLRINTAFQKNHAFGSPFPICQLGDLLCFSRGLHLRLTALPIELRVAGLDLSPWLPSKCRICFVWGAVCQPARNLVPDQDRYPDITPLFFQWRLQTHALPA